MALTFGKANLREILFALNLITVLDHISKNLHHLRKVSYAALIEYRRAKMNADSYLIEKSLQKIHKINDLMRLAHKNKKCYHHKTCGDLREYYYVNGRRCILQQTYTRAR